MSFFHTMPVPATRGEAIALLQKLGWNDEELGPEERQAVRNLYRLDEDGPIAGTEHTKDGQ